MKSKMVQRCRRNLSKHSLPNGYRFGAELADVASGPNEAETPIDPIQRIISATPIDAIEEGIWLKFMGSGSNRQNADEKLELTFISDTGEVITNFPQKPTGIKENAYIYIASVTTDKGGRNTPVVVARARTFGYDENNIVSEATMREYSWMHNYPYYIVLYDFEYLLCDVKDGISLIDVLAEVGSATYPNSKGAAKSLTELKTVHHQKDKLRITEECKVYLDARFDELAAEYGTEKVANVVKPIDFENEKHTEGTLISINDLEQRLYVELIANTKECQKLGYNPTTFLEMLSKYGTLGTARKLIHAPHVSDGYSKLFMMGRLDLTLEAVVLKPEYARLLTQDELNICASRIR